MPVLKTKKNGQWVEVYGAPSEAEKNVQVDWSETDATSDKYIQHKPTLGTIAEKDVIDMEDLTENVQALLAKADSALQADSPVLTGTPTVTSNTNYTTAQIRNVIYSTDEPTDSDGNDGDLWIVYEE